MDQNGPLAFYFALYAWLKEYFRKELEREAWN
jgi:hypothetical protein